MALGLNAIISADSGPFKAGVNQAERAIGGLESSLNRIGGLIAGAFAVDRIINFSQKIYEQASSLDDLSRQLGTSTKAVAALRIVSNMTGVSFESAERAMIKLNKALGNAAMNGGPVSDALQRLGLDAADLAAGDKITALMKIQEALGGITNASERTSLAFDVLSKSGPDAIRLMEYDLRKALIEADRFGLAISNADSEALEEAGRSAKRIGLAIEGAATQVVIGMLPGLQQMANSLDENSAKTKEWLETWREIGEVIGKTGNAVSWLSAAIQSAALSVASAAADVLYVWSKIDVFLSKRDKEEVAAFRNSLRADEVQGLKGVRNAYEKMIGGGKETPSTSGSLRLAVSPESEDVGAAQKPFGLKDKMAAWWDSAAKPAIAGIMSGMESQTWAAYGKIGEYAKNTKTGEERYTDTMREIDALRLLPGADQGVLDRAATKAEEDRAKEWSPVLDFVKSLGDRFVEVGKTIARDLDPTLYAFTEKTSQLNAAFAAGMVTEEQYGKLIAKYSKEGMDARRAEWKASPEGQIAVQQQDAAKTYQDRLGDLNQSTLLDSVFSPSRRYGGTFGATRDAGAQVAMSRGMAVADWQQKSAEYLRKLVEIAFDYQRSLSPDKVYM